MDRLGGFPTPFILAVVGMLVLGCFPLALWLYNLSKDKAKAPVSPGMDHTAQGG